MKKKRHIQLFTVRPEAQENNVEIDAELVSISCKDGGYHVVTKEEGGELWEHYFPLHNVSMIRISDL
jgi:hypothetical protein